MRERESSEEDRRGFGGSALGNEEGTRWDYGIGGGGSAASSAFDYCINPERESSTFP